MTKYLIAFLFIFYLFNLSPVAISQDKLDPRTGRSVYPKHVVFIQEGQSDTSIVYAETGLVPIIFKIDKHTYIPSPQLDSTAALVEKVINDKRIDFQYLWIGGSASPEGPVKHNIDLGRWRSEVLYKFIIENTSVDPARIRTANLAEDWEGFRRSLLKDKDHPKRDTLLNIIEGTPDWTLRKRKIQALDNGKTWHNLIYGTFTPYRNARMVIVCKANEHPKINRVADIQTPLLSPPSIKILTPYTPPPVFPTARETRFIALKNNLLIDGILAANIGFEVELWRKTSIDIPFVYSPYDIRVPDRKIRLFGTQPEFRYWLGKKAGEGHFIGVHGTVLGFNIALNDRGRFQDPNHALWNAGIGYGFSLNFGHDKRWALEANIGAGYAEYKYDTYRNWYNGARFESDMADNYWGITRAGISVMYKWYVPRKGKK